MITSGYPDDGQSVQVLQTTQRSEMAFHGKRLLTRCVKTHINSLALLLSRCMFAWLSPLHALIRQDLTSQRESPCSHLSLSHRQRLKPYTIDVRSPIDPVHWFLDGKDDVRSSYYLEDVATEFQVQGLELDWTCLAWDADFRRKADGWQHFSFRGNKWQSINKIESQHYQLNAYRVLLTRARQGMVIVVPAGDESDHTRNPSFYNQTYRYLRDVGIREL